MDLNSPDMVLRYKANASRNGLMVSAATAPVWAVWMPFVMWWMLGIIIADRLQDTADVLAVLVFFGLISVAAIATIFVCKDNRLVIGSNGIKVPVRFILQTLLRTQFKWKDLDKIVFQKDGKPSAEADEICFVFKGGSSAPMRLEGFQREDVPKILLAVQAYAPQAKIEPSSESIQGLALNRVTAPLSFTKIWEEELNSRFGSTIFVPLEPGHELQDGRIKIVGQIAFGGLSAIYLARNAEQKLVVLKEAVVPQNADEASKEKALEMFDREARFLISLKHQRIARVYDHFVENGHHYMELQYIEGKDLRTYVKENGPVPEQVVARWAWEIAEILTYLHDLNPPIVHRDLTPDNLVLARDGSICLIDFGAANNFMGTATGTLVGKQSYISPEQFRGKACPASDLYSLGCTLYFLLTGKDPEPLSVVHPQEEKSTISSDIDALVASLTEQEVADRIKPASNVLKTIEELNANVQSQLKAAHHA